MTRLTNGKGTELCFSLGNRSGKIEGEKSGLGIRWGEEGIGKEKIGEAKNKNNISHS